MRRAVLDSDVYVSMESGLEDRNNVNFAAEPAEFEDVSMESGLEDRNNARSRGILNTAILWSLNGVRPRRPEQLM